MRLLETLQVLVDASCQLACITCLHPICVAFDTVQMDELELGYSVVQGETES